MSSHTVDEILRSWRELERQHDEARDDELREQIEARLAALRDQYQAAFNQARQAEADRRAETPSG